MVDVPLSRFLAHLLKLMNGFCACRPSTCRSRLPTSLQQLDAYSILGVQPLLGLTQLQDLEISCLASRQQLQQLAAAIGSSITSISISEAPRDMAKVLLSKRFDHTLPLTELGFIEGDISAFVSAKITVLSAAHLGQWRKLRSLALPDYMKFVETPEQLAAQLQMLTCLTSLALSANVGGSHYAPVLQPVVDCIVGLSSLKCLLMRDQQLTGEQRATLQALTCLTELDLRCLYRRPPPSRR